MTMKKIKKKSVKKERKFKDYFLHNLDNIDWEKVEKIFEPDKKLILRELEKSSSNYPYTTDILKLLACGALIGLSVFFPALPVALTPFVIDGRKYQSGRLTQTIRRLKKQKLVEIFEENGQQLVRITDRGKMRVLKYKLDDIKIDKPKHWDRKWRIVIFDIPNKYKRMRDIFRKRLQLLGFYKLQESVWVYPYPCAEQIEFLRQIYNVGVDVRYIIADKIEDAEDLIDRYNLN